MNNYLANTMEFILTKVRKEHNDLRMNYSHSEFDCSFTFFVDIPVSNSRGAFTLEKRLYIKITDTQVACNPPHVLVKEICLAIEDEVN